MEKLFHKSPFFQAFFFFTTFHFFVVLRNRVDFLPCFENEATPKKRWQLCFQRDWRNILPCELVNYPYSTFSSYWGVCDLNDDFQMRGRLSSRSLWHWYDETSSIPEDVPCCYSSSSVLWLRLWRSFSHATPLPTWWEELRNPSRKICSNYH